jgi:hypothetical protein
MAFPVDPLPLTSEIFVDGAWLDITSDIREDEGVTISGRGNSNEDNSLSSAVCSFKLNNRLGVYSNRNPRSALYGKLPKNTPFRAKIDDSAVTLQAWPTGDEIVYIQTADKAVLDITGDIDIRLDVDMLHWSPQAADSIILASKFQGTGNQRSWYLSLTQSGLLRFSWYTLGTSASIITGFSTVPVPIRSGRQAIRITLDVNDGLGGLALRFYTSDTISGSWTQLGATRTAAITTSIFNSTATLVVGGLDGGNAGSTLSPSPDYMYGKWYGFELRNGIGGTLVADLDLTTQTPGATSWSDGLGTPNTWTLIGDSGEVATGNRRFTGEIAQMPVEWDTTGSDIYIRTQANDVTRRLTQGKDALRSALYRYIQSDFAELGELTGHWPFEDASGSTQAFAATGGTGYVTDVTFTEDSSLPASAGVVKFNAATSLIGAAANVTDVSDTNAFVFFMRCETLPTADRTVFYIRSTGTMRRWEIMVGPTSGSMRLRSYDSSGALSINSVIGPGVPYPDVGWVMWSLYLEQNGGNVDYSIKFQYVTPDAPVLSGSGSYAGTVGRMSSWVSGQHAELIDFSFAQVFISRNIDNSDLYTTSLLAAATAFIGETAADRLRRLGREESVAVQVVGAGADTVTMGYQRPLTLVDLFKECATADGGILFTPREFLGYRYRTRKSMMNQTGLSLSYSANDLSGQLRPTDDDQNVRNDVTLSRPFGSEGRHERTDGPNGIDSIGRYKTSYSVNLEEDSKLVTRAQWETFIGTWDEARYPTVTVQLERSNFVNDAAKTLDAYSTDVGDFFEITNMPDFLPPDDVELLVRGVREKLDNRGVNITWNATPYGPFRSNDLTGSDESNNRASATNSRLAYAANSTTTTLPIRTATGKLWGTTAGKPSNFPLSAKIGGELVTVSAINNLTWTFVGVGTAAHANNASVTGAGMPTGWQAGDLLLMLTASRATGVNSTTPAGWQRLGGSGNVEIMARKAQTGDTAPTVVFPGTVAGDDNSVQLCAFRPSTVFATSSVLTDFVIKEDWLTNASAQDIATPASWLQPQWTADSLILYVGWKQDDWTSVASPGTEIGEPDTTTGNDQGMVWSYTIQTARTAIAANSFVVTGGASAVSKGGVLVINPRQQQFTVTRSVNGIVKSQDSQTAITVEKPFYVTL